VAPSIEDTASGSLAYRILFRMNSAAAQSLGFRLLPAFIHMYHFLHLVAHIIAVGQSFRVNLRTPDTKS
jgi:hypothetical protein